MKKIRNHSQLKEQKESPKAINNERDLCSLTDIEFKRERVKTLKELRLNIKELREDMNSNADFFFLFSFFLSFVLLGPHPQHMEVPRLGV